MAKATTSKIEKRGRMIHKLATKYATLSHLTEEVLAYCDSLSESRLRQRSDGKWNAIQILYHLSVSEIGTTHYLQNKLKAKPSQVRNGGIRSYISSLLLTSALKMHRKKFKAPKILTEVPDRPDYEKTKLRIIKNRELMETVLESFDENMAKKAYFKHPLAGRLNIYQTLDFLNSHFERHAMQIKARTKA